MRFIYFTAGAAMTNESDSCSADNPWSVCNIIKINCENKNQVFQVQYSLRQFINIAQRTPAQCHLGGKERHRRESSRFSYQLLAKKRSEAANRALFLGVYRALSPNNRTLILKVAFHHSGFFWRTFEAVMHTSPAQRPQIASGTHTKQAMATSWRSLN